MNGEDVEEVEKKWREEEREGRKEGRGGGRTGWTGEGSCWLGWSGRWRESHAQKLVGWLVVEAHQTRKRRGRGRKRWTSAVVQRQGRVETWGEVVTVIFPLLKLKA